MEPRERVLRALAFQVPDRPPISHAYCLAPAPVRRRAGAGDRPCAEDFGWSLLPDMPAEECRGYREATLWTSGHL